MKSLPTKSIAALAILLSASLPSASAQEARQTPPASSTQAPGQVFKMRLGHFKIVAIGDGIFSLPTDQLLVDAHPGEVRALLAAGHQPVVEPTSVNAYLVDTGRKRILVDTGGGAFFGAALGRFGAGLRAAGYRPQDIDEVLLTHLHPDHVGGLVIDGKPVFPNAVIRLQEREEAFWLDKSNADKVDASVSATFDAASASLAPYSAAGRVRTFKPGALLEPGITAIDIPGHTPGHSAYRIESEGKTLLIWGDVMHVAAVQLTDPAITIRFDYMPDLARATREQLMNETMRRGDLIAGAHLAFPGIGRLRKAADKWQWLPVSSATPR